MSLNLHTMQLILIIVLVVNLSGATCDHPQANIHRKLRSFFQTRTKKALPVHWDNDYAKGPVCQSLNGAACDGKDINGGPKAAVPTAPPKTGTQSCPEGGTEGFPHKNQDCNPPTPIKQAPKEMICVSEEGCEGPGKKSDIVEEKTGGGKCSSADRTCDEGGDEDGDEDNDEDGDEDDGDEDGGEGGGMCKDVPKKCDTGASPEKSGGREKSGERDKAGGPEKSSGPPGRSGGEVPGRPAGEAPGRPPGEVPGRPPGEAPGTPIGGPLGGPPHKTSNGSDRGEPSGLPRGPGGEQCGIPGPTEGKIVVDMMQSPPKTTGQDNKMDQKDKGPPDCRHRRLIRTGKGSMFGHLRDDSGRSQGYHQNGEVRRVANSGVRNGPVHKRAGKKWNEEKEVIRLKKIGVSGPVGAWVARRRRSQLEPMTLTKNHWTVPFESFQA